MVQGTPAYCLPRQISFNAPISSARAALAGHCLLFRPLAEKSPQRIFALCRVAAAKLGRVLNASRPDATNRPDGRTPFGAADARVTALDRPWSDASRVYSAWSQPGSDPSGGGACEVTSLYSWSCNTNHGYDEVQLRFARFRNDA